MYLFIFTSSRANVIQNLNSKINMKRKTRHPHTELCRSVERYLGLRSDLFLWHNNTGAGMMGKRFVRFGYPGSADFIGLLRGGVMLCIECKTGDARQTFEQRQFQERIKTLGGLYFVIRSLDELIKVLQSLGLDDTANLI